MNTDPEILKYLHPALTADQSDGFVKTIEAELEEKGWGLWAVELRSSGGFIGFIGFHQAVFDAPFTPCVEIGWRLKSKAWGRGYATEGARCCLEHGFGEFGLKEVYSFTSRENLRSRRVMEKIGLRYIGDFDHPNVPKNDPLRPHLLYRGKPEASE
jgi:ribosomal-protein-alanine N-acetyltransferase